MLAERMFVSKNELQFSLDNDPLTGVDVDDLAPPQPYLDIDTTSGTPLRRQSTGEITWSAIAVPRRKTGLIGFGLPNPLGNRAEGFDFHILVSKDRSFEDPLNFATPDRDPRFLFSQLPVISEQPDDIYGSGTIILGSPVDIRNDEWLMLVNYDASNQIQIGFFRVIGSDPARNAITLDGSDFIIRDFVDGNPNRTPTFAVYLPNVVGVYKRQLFLESDSTAN